MSSSGRIADDELSEFGVVTIGKIDSKLVETVRLGVLNILKQFIW
jgi:hypothetical protein